LKENFDRFNSQIYKEKEMADFRRCIFALAVVALLFAGLAPTANAQGTPAFQCVANAAVPPTVRSEGLTELVGDIVLNCNGGTPVAAGQQIPQANITIFLNTQVTSRLLSGNLAESILTIDEPNVGQTSPAQTCTDVTGCAAFGAGPTANSIEFKQSFTVGSTTFLNRNVYQGQVSGNSVSFVGIPIDAPGTTFTRIYRITNVRANATIPAPGGSGTPGQIIALISATPATSPGGGSSSFPINNPTQIVGFVQTSLTTSITAAGGTGALGAADIQIRQCIGRAGTAAALGQLNYTELFPTAFKTRTINGTGTAQQNTLGLVYNSESGYINANLGSGGGGIGTIGGGADFGTRLKAVFNNVPNGVSIFVSTNTPGFSSTASPTSATAAFMTSSETGAYSPVTATTTLGSGVSIFQVPLVNGSGQAIWEVTAAHPLVNQTYSFLYYAVATASPATNSPAVGTGTVNMSYAPVPPVFAAAAGAVASASLPIPRFIDTSTASNVISVILCRTNLLYPFVTNIAGFDTGLAISNTSTDPFGTAAQQGPCTLNFYGSNAPAAVTTAPIASGTTYTNLASLAAPNFQGYVIAVCNFQYAHGFAFVSDLGARNLAMGYLALIIPDPPRSAFPFECGGNSTIPGCAATGEQLGF
jgi:hypothetical protein